ncbi:fibronectin type III domain-containing protein [Sulfolobaceae archaeon RB850M]
MVKRYLLFLLLLLSIIFPVVNSNVGFVSKDLPNLPIPLFQSAVAYYNNSIYVIGGITSSGFVTSNVFVYSNGQWLRGPSLPFELAGSMAVVLNGNLYVVGGFNNSGIFGGVLELVGNSWVVINDNMPQPVYSGIAFAYDDKIYVIGGVNYTGFNIGPPSDLIQVYSLSSNSWSIIGKSPQPLAYSGYYFNGSVLFVVGGYIGYASSTPYVYEYLPANNSWANLPPLPSGVYAEALGCFNGVLFGVGGYYYSDGRFIPGAIYYLYDGEWYLSSFNESVPTIYSSYVQVGDTLYIIGGLYAESQAIVSTFQSVTLLLPPPKPVITYAVAGNNSITLSWFDTNATGYYLVYWSDNNIKHAINVGDRTTYTISGLTDGVEYFVQIIPYNSLGNGTPSDLISLTPGTVPNPPIVNVILGNRNATITWNPTFNGGFPIEGYYIVVRGDGLDIEENVGNSTYFTLTNLVPNTVYKVEVIAYNKLGNSSPSFISFVAITKANISVSFLNEQQGLLMMWNSTEKATYVLTITNQQGKIVINVTLTGNSYLAKLPFGAYNITIKAINPAGVTVFTTNYTYYLSPQAPLVNLTVEGNIIKLNWSEVKYANFYLIYDNNTLIANVSGLSYEFPANLGLNVIKVYAGNAFALSSPYTYVVNIHEIVDSVNTTVKDITITTATESVDMSGISLTEAIVVILLFIISLSAVAVLVKKL